MDANLQRPYQLAAREAWTLDARTAWDAQARRLRLIGTRAPRWTEALADGAARRARPPGAVDRFGTHALVERVDEPAGLRWRVVATGAVAGGRVIVPSGAAEITDAVIAGDVLYLALGGAVVLHDLRERWQPVTVAVTGGRAWRLAPAPGGVHVALVDRGGHVVGLGSVVGLPMRPVPHRHSPDTFRPRPEDADPPRFVPGESPPAAGVAALATSPGGRLAIVAWEEAGDALLFVRAGETWAPARALAGARRPYSLAWLDDDRVAVLVATEGGGTSAGVYVADGAGVASPVGELYPLQSPAPLPFLHGVEAPPQYLSQHGAVLVVRPLLPLSWPAYGTAGDVVAAAPLDAGALGEVWHRLYLEAAIPPGASVTVWLAATDDRARPPDDAWFPHRFGDPVPGDPAPRGAWLAAPSELPFHSGLLGCPPRPGVAGLFTALVQRAGRRVRALAGRYLWVRLELTGDGRSTPEVAAVRVYAGRRGYAGLYLPELYREDLFGPEADTVGPATPADFLDRFLASFEGILTPLEDRIAGAWLLTHPRTTPDHAVDWLASWLGFVFAADLPPGRRRRMLAEAWPLYQRRGTFAGLRRAIDIATDGGVTRGEIVVVEDFRLRRTFATILGADLADEDDPLMPGLAISGNSVVGDTLLLGDEERRAFLALYDAELTLGAAREAADAEAIAELFDRLAHRATVLVHQEIAEHDLGLVRQVIALEAPAHVQVKVVTATYRFRVAVASLVGVDTYLGPQRPPSFVAVDRSSVGVADRVERLPSLDPRLGRTL